MSKFSASSLLVTAVLTVLVTADLWTVAALPVVSFRLDDVQAWWCEDISQTVIDVFIEENIPINLGIIGEDINNGAGIDEYLLGLAGNPLIEMSSHSFKHESFEGKNYSWQYEDMSLNDDMITSVTTQKANAFIPPLNEYDNNTIAAAVANGMDIFSAECTWSWTVPNTTIVCKDIVKVVAPDIIRDGVHMLPAGAVLGGEDYWTDFLLNASLADAISWIESQIENQGFSVVMLHPVEFAMTNNCVNLNNEKIQILRDLFAYGRTRWDFMTFTNAGAAITSSTLPEAPSLLPSSAPSLLPSIAPSLLPSSAPSVSAKPTTYLEKVKPVVSFRLDDVQAYWCEDISRTVIDFFISENIPINVGIIGENLHLSDPMNSYLRNLASNPLIEMSSHSYYHDSFEGQPYSWQYDDIELNNLLITTVVRGQPNSFIPPLNEFDNNTMAAAKANGLNVFSAECTWSLTEPNTRVECKDINNVVAPDIIRDEVYMMPAGAVLGGSDYWNDYLLEASLEDAVNWIELQIENQGFSVVMLHPVEFANSYACNSLDNAKINVLRDLFAFGRTKWQFETFSAAAAEITAEITPTGFPSEAPTATPTEPSALPSVVPTISSAPTSSPTNHTLHTSKDGFFEDLSSSPLLIGLISSAFVIVLVLFFLHRWRDALCREENGKSKKQKRAVGRTTSANIRRQKSIVSSSLDKMVPTSPSVFNYASVFDDGDVTVEMSNPFRSKV